MQIDAKRGKCSYLTVYDAALKTAVKDRRKDIQTDLSCSRIRRPSLDRSGFSLG